MTTAPWWTEADEAEWKIALWATICALEDITDKAARYRLWDLLLDWRYKRALLSKAEWLRRRHLHDRLAEIKELVA